MQRDQSNAKNGIIGLPYLDNGKSTFFKNLLLEILYRESKLFSFSSLQIYFWQQFWTGKTFVETLIMVVLIFAGEAGKLMDLTCQLLKILYKRK